MHLNPDPINVVSAAPSFCPCCGRPIAAELLHLSSKIDTLTHLQLKETYPGWDESQPICPECAYSAAQAARSEASLTSIQDELLLPFPVYTHEDTRLLPTPYRIGASQQFSGRGITIALIDSGFYPHPDLTQPRNRILSYVDASSKVPIERDDFSQLGTSSWHGLMTSCIAAGNGYKSGGVYQSAASQANLVLVKAGNPYNRGIREVDIERALRWVIDNRSRFKIRIVNISLGGDYPPRRGILSDLDQLVEKATRLGIIVVAAAGNSGIERLLPPATAPSAITVGGLNDCNSLDSRHWKMYHSNFGKDPYGHPKPELIAPAIWLAAPMLPKTQVHREGVRLWRLNRLIESSYNLLESGGIKTFIRRAPTLGRLKEKHRQIRQRMIEQKYIHPHYQHVDGTSMAAPVVTSIIAQMLEANPALKPAQVKHILTSTAVPFVAVPLEHQGAGVIQPASAVAVALRFPGGPLAGLPLSPQEQADRIIFYYYDPTGQVKQIGLAGNYNGWEGQSLTRDIQTAGLWRTAIPRLLLGQSRYNFIVDGSWLNDPENPHRVENGFGGFSSILEIKT